MTNTLSITLNDTPTVREALLYLAEVARHEIEHCQSDESEKAIAYKHIAQQIEQLGFVASLPEE